MKNKNTQELTSSTKANFGHGFLRFIQVDASTSNSIFNKDVSFWVISSRVDAIPDNLQIHIIITPGYTTTQKATSSEVKKMKSYNSLTKLGQLYSNKTTL